MTSFETVAATYPSQRVKEVFGSLAIDKSRLPASGLTSMGIPSFVAEWLLDKIVPGTGPMTSAEIEKLNTFVQKAFPRKDDKEEIKFFLSQGDVHKLIALMQVRVKLEGKNAANPERFARIPVLNIEECQISSDLVERNRMLLRQGLWGKISLSHRPGRGLEVIDFDPFQCSTVNLQAFADCRAQFNTTDWRDIVFCSMGFNPEHERYSIEAKTWVLSRLLPLVESNYHIMELAPKGTGKSFVYENVSSKVSLISGGKVTPARLFIDGRTKEIGLLGRHDVVVLDEVQSLTFTNADEMIGPLKNYLASGKYNRAGFQEVSSDCSLVMLANIELDEKLRPRNPSNPIAELPMFFSETAFLDRFAGIVPGWEIPKFMKEMAGRQVGLKMDFFGEAMLSLRRDSRFMSYVQQHTQFGANTNIRDQNAILKSACGFLKILYPHLELTLEDYCRDCLEPAQRLRQAIRDILYYLDEEFRQTGREIIVQTC